MRIAHLSDSQIQEFLDQQYEVSSVIAEHLTECPSCQFRVTEYAETFGLLNGINTPTTDPELIDRVMTRLSKRGEFLIAIRYAGCSFGATIVGAVALEAVGSGPLLSVIVPVWNSLTAITGYLTTAVTSMISQLGQMTSTTGAILAVSAACALVWVGLLDKATGYMRAIRHS